MTGIRTALARYCGRSPARIGSMMALLALASAAAHAQKSDLQVYVESCQTELLFTASEVKPMNCNDGPNFATSSVSGINDYVVHQRVNPNVDMVAACRWGNGIHDEANNTKFISLELLIHNRQNGGTCFFAAKDIGPDSIRPISTAIVSPTNFSNVYPDADDYWLTPAQINSKQLTSNGRPDIAGFKESLQCVRCHSQGPYIASLRIAPFLANFGLMNDGHDTFVNFSAQNHYYVVGAGTHANPDPGTHPFANWHYLINRQNVATECSGACHTLSYKTPLPGTPGQSSLMIGDLFPPNESGKLLPSINTDRIELQNSGAMEPTADDSAFRWVNSDQPSSESVEIETFTSSRPNVPVLREYCGSPAWLEASAVGSLATFSTQQMNLLPDKLRAFNLRDGLTCRNSDQPGGRRCNNYQVSFKCGGPKKAVKWTPFYNRDATNSDDGEHEERSRSLSDAIAWCNANVLNNNNKPPVAFRAQVVGSSTNPIINAPADRLAQFVPSGLVCRNADQGSGQSCSNYTVRYRGCQPKNVANLVRVRSAWTNPPTFSNRVLTTTNNVNGAETRAQGGNFQYPSQDWIIEGVPGGITVRLKDVWSGKYLTASSTTDLAPVLVNDSNSTLMRQQWIMDPVNGSSTEFRFRNVGTSRYLTVGNYTGSDPYFAPIISQTYSSQNWASQRWIVQ